MVMSAFMGYRARKKHRRNTVVVIKEEVLPPPAMGEAMSLDDIFKEVTEEARKIFR